MANRSSLSVLLAITASATAHGNVFTLSDKGLKSLDWADSGYSASVVAVRDVPGPGVEFDIHYPSRKTPGNGILYFSGRSGGAGKLAEFDLTAHDSFGLSFTLMAVDGVKVPPTGDSLVVGATVYNRAMSYSYRPAVVSLASEGKNRATSITDLREDGIGGLGFETHFLTYSDGWKDGTTLTLLIEPMPGAIELPEQFDRVPFRRSHPGAPKRSESQSPRKFDGNAKSRALQPPRAVREKRGSRAAFPLYAPRAETSTRSGMSYREWLIGMALASGRSAADSIREVDEVLRRFDEGSDDGLVAAQSRSGREIDVNQAGTVQPEQLAARVAAAVVHIDLSLEDDASAPIQVIFQDKHIVREASPGRIDLDVSGLPNGHYYVYFESPGYASQWIVVDLPNAVASGVPRQIELFRERYVVMRYAFNNLGGRSLAGGDVQEGRVAVAHWGKLEFFGEDWQVWQRSDGTALFGRTPYLEFHRFASGFGFLKPQPDTSFDALNELAESGYRCENVRAVKGTVLLCRVNGNRPEGEGYGKIVIEDVTEAPPQGVRVVRSRGRSAILPRSQTGRDAEGGNKKRDKEQPEPPLTPRNDMDEPDESVGGTIRVKMVYIGEGWPLGLVPADAPTSPCSDRRPRVVRDVPQMAEDSHRYWGELLLGQIKHPNHLQFIADEQNRSVAEVYYQSTTDAEEWNTAENQGHGGFGTHMELELTYPGKSEHFPYRIWFFPNVYYWNTHRAAFYSVCHRRGQLRLKGQSYTVVLFDNNPANGDYSDDPVVIDLNHDNRVQDNERLTPGSPFTIGGHSWTVQPVEASGEEISFERR